MQFHFLQPHILWLLALVPPLGAALVIGVYKRLARNSGAWGESELVEPVSRLPSPDAYKYRALFVFLGLSGLIVAIARPSLENGRMEFPAGTRDVVAIVDTSRSMARPDYPGKLKDPKLKSGTRLKMAHHLLKAELIPSLHGNRLAAVTFAGKPWAQAFLTDDLAALESVLDERLTINSAPGEGSALCLAFKLAFEMFDLDSDDSKKKTIVLFSDGGNDDSTIDLGVIAQECRDRKISVIIVGLGSTTPGAIPVTELSPNDRIQMRDKEWFEIDGEVVKTALDEIPLMFLKNKTGGRYVRVVNPSDFKMDKMVAESEVRYVKGEQELFVYPLALSLLCLLVASLVTLELRRPQAENGRRSSRRRRR